MITVRKVTRSLAAVMPGWPVVIRGVCRAIRLARLAALLFTAGLALVQPARAGRGASAWTGGKSHHGFDEVPALSGAGQGPAIYGRYGGA
jgi:hypothetical protein